MIDCCDIFVGWFNPWMHNLPMCSSTSGVILDPTCASKGLLPSKAVHQSYIWRTWKSTSVNKLYHLNKNNIWHWQRKKNTHSQTKSLRCTIYMYMCFNVSYGTCSEIGSNSLPKGTWMIHDFFCLLDAILKPFPNAKIISTLKTFWKNMQVASVTALHRKIKNNF